MTEKKYKKVTAEISSFVGISLGAIHCYLKLTYDDEKGQTVHKRLEHTLTATQALKLNKRERYSTSGSDFRYKKGDKSQGFWSETEAEKWAVKYFKENLGDYDILFVGSSSCLDPQKCLYTKNPVLKDILNDFYKKAVKLDFYEKRENEEEMEKLSLTFMKLVYPEYLK